MNKRLCLLGVLASFATTPVMAGGINPANWTGIFGGVGLNWTSWSQKKDKTAPDAKKLKVSGLGYGLELGGGAAVLPNLYLGANFSFDFSSASKKITDGPATIKFKQKNGYAGTLQIGVPLCNFMPYAEVGYGRDNGRFVTTGSNDPDDNVSVKTNSKGAIYGLGLKYQPAKSVLLGIGYRFSPQKIKVKGQEDSTKIRSNSIRLSASYLFNF